MKQNTRRLYPTPYGLTEELVKTGVLNDCSSVLEPCCGQYAISKILEKNGFNVVSKDLIYGNDFLKDDYSNEKYDAIVTNPPFFLWNEILTKAKEVATKKVVAIGRVNYFGSHSRNINGIWDNLSDVYIFDRQVAYNSEFREDGKMTCGCLVTGWFVWEKDYKDFPRLHILDVQNWIVNVKSEKNKNLRDLIFH